jgi:hypothetical protein
MSPQLQHLYDFGPYRLDAANHLLLKDGEPIPLTPKAFDTLLALVQERNIKVDISILKKVLVEIPNGHLNLVTARNRYPRYVILNQGDELIIKEHTRLRIVIEEEARDQTEIMPDGQSILAVEADSHQWQLRWKAWVISFSIIALVLMISYLLLIGISR